MSSPWTVAEWAGASSLRPGEIAGDFRVLAGPIPWGDPRDGKLQWAAQCLHCERVQSALQGALLRGSVVCHRCPATQPHAAYREWQRATRSTRLSVQQRAIALSSSAAREGAIEKPAECSRCGDRPRKLQGHHESYARPLDVIWLCIPCHRVRHIEINRAGINLWEGVEGIPVRPDPLTGEILAKPEAA